MRHVERAAAVVGVSTYASPHRNSGGLKRQRQCPRLAIGELKNNNNRQKPLELQIEKYEGYDCKDTNREVKYLLFIPVSFRVVWSKIREDFKSKC